MKDLRTKTRKPKRNLKVGDTQLILWQMRVPKPTVTMVSQQMKIRQKGQEELDVDEEEAAKVWRSGQGSQLRLKDI
tara:strand:+ start:38 stop:265 length:228 start_codon:yes stop_codon:yes gene_type:complete